jgi:hypothetical protein
MSWGVLQGTAVMTLQMKSPTSVEEIRGHTRLMAIHLRLRRAKGVLTVNFPALAPGGPTWTNNTAPDRLIRGVQGATPLTPADLGIDKTASHRYQTIARLPAPDFETHIMETKAAGLELTSGITGAGGLCPACGAAWLRRSLITVISESGPRVWAYVPLSGSMAM